MEGRAREQESLLSLKISKSFLVSQFFLVALSIVERQQM
jgi:hypothetical protein